ncbi:MAG: Gfo/Idh/MocA family oxidoreductase [Clostridia bacterium]
MLNVAVVGSGYIGLSHIEAYKALDGAQVVCVINRSKEKNEKGVCAAGAPCKAYTSLEEALKEEVIDLVDVCTPTNTHEQFVIEAANAGRHVLCEKPVTFEMDAFDRMSEACAKNGVRFMVAQVARWWPEFQVIKDCVDAGKLGKIHMIYEKRLAQHPTWSAWHRKPEVSGGGLYDMNVHDIDFLYTLFGMPERVYATGWKSPSGCWNHVATNISWKDGTRAICETSLEMTGNFPFSIEFRGCGDKGTIAYSLTAGHNIKDGERGFDFNFYPAGTETVEALEAKQGDMFVGEIGGFIDAINAGTPAPVTLEQSRAVLKIVLAIRKSLEEGTIESLA